ncbi:MAG: DNA-binding LytR/AlgR family response regulator [Flavobacteriaceae bacterium]|jgi:DNA-binding LytR/AlgR family response regulator
MTFQHNGLDYLLKPIQLELLTESIERFKNTRSTTNVDAEIIARIRKEKQTAHKQRFLVKSGDQLNFIEIENIAYFVSEASYSFTLLKSGNQ